MGINIISNQDNLYNTFQKQFCWAGGTAGIVAAAVAAGCQLSWVSALISTFSIFFN